jgi:hypothetical protein
VEIPPSPEALKARRYFNLNRVKVPREQLLPYAGQCVAWAPDGTRVVDSDDDGLVLWNRLRERGGSPWDFVYERLRPAEALGSPEDCPRILLPGGPPLPPPEEDPCRGVQYSIWNRSIFPVEILAPHAGKWVVWSIDGTWIIDSDGDDQALLERSRERGENPCEYLHEYLHSPGEMFV